jgi:hypothetical protein
MWGEVKCNSDAATCTLDGEDSHIVMAISGYAAGDNVLTVRAFTVTNGKWDSCGGIGVSENAIVDIILCIFIDNEPVGAGAGAIGVMGGILNVYGCTYYGNTATQGGADVTNFGGTVTLHETCPSPYTATTPVQGAALQTHGTIQGATHAYSCSTCVATTDESDDGTGPDGKFYCINGGIANGPDGTCKCLHCDEGYGGPNCATCPTGSIGTPPNNCEQVAANVCIASTTPTDDGTDSSNFYCVNGGTVGGIMGSCTCTGCNTGFSGDFCQLVQEPTPGNVDPEPTPAPTTDNNMVIIGDNNKDANEANNLPLGAIFGGAAAAGVAIFAFYIFRNRRRGNATGESTGGGKEKAQLAVVAPDQQKGEE